MSEAKPNEGFFFAYAQNFNLFNSFIISAISSKKYIFEEEKNWTGFQFLWLRSRALSDSSPDWRR